MSRYEHISKKFERERIVYQTIKNHPNYNHNAILKLVVPKFMAKTTFEKTRDSLLEKEIIIVAKQGNMKFYSVVGNYDDKFLQRIEKRTNNLFHDLKLQIKRLDTDYQHKDIDEKITHANSILNNLLFTDNGFTFLDSFKNPKKTLYRDEHLTIQQLIYHVFKVLRKDNDFEIIFPAIVSDIESFNR